MLASLALAAGMAVMGAPPASACTSNCAQAQTYVWPSSSDNFVAVAATLTVTEVFGSSYDSITDHWVGIQNADGSRLVQAGYDWRRDTGSNVYLEVWYEFYTDCPPVNLALGGTQDRSHLGFTPFTGDTLYFHLWYNSTYNGWGLQITDNNIPATWSYYVYPSIAGVCSGNAANYRQHYAIVSTENHLSGNPFFNGYTLLNDGTETFKQPQAAIAGGGMVLFENFGANNAVQNMYDIYGTEMESATATDPNGYAYHAWIQGS